MREDDLQKLKVRFDDYCRSFLVPSAEDARNMSTKQGHTHEVCRNAALIATELGLSANDVLLAEAVALFHDIGRFPQYVQYKTFNDRTSVNHGALGAEVLVKHGMLEGLEQCEQEIILPAVKYHNAYAIPPELEPRAMLFTRLVRDADKLDIWRVAIQYYSGAESYRAEAVVLGLQDTPGYSSEALNAVLSGKLVRMAGLKNLNDFKLVQLAWVYDLNFEASVRMVVERRYIEQLERFLPQTREIARAVEIVRGHMDRRLRNDGSASLTGPGD